MKHHPVQLILAAATALLILPVSSIHASNVTLTNNDAVGTSSFAAAGNWSNGQAPSAANTYQSAFTLRAAATATFQGASLEILSGGDLRIKNNGTAATVNDLILDNGGVVDLGTAGAATLAGNISLPSGQAYISGGTSGAGLLTVSSLISGAGGLITSASLINGPGTNIFTAANTYSGATTINNSTNPVALQLGNANAVQDSTVTVSLANGLKFSPGIGAFHIGALAGSVAETLADTGGSAVTLSVGGNNASSTYSGVLGGSGALTKAGTGTLTLSAANTYTGATTISAGTLALSASGSLAAGSSVSIAAGATLDVSAQSTYTFGSSATLSASGNTSAATIKGGTTVSLGSRPVTLTYDGSHAALTLSAGTLQLNNNAVTVVVPGTALAAGTYTLVATPGTISGTPDATPSFTGGNGIASGDTGTLSVNGNNVVLTVSAGGGSNVTLTNNDAVGTSSFAAAGNWSNGQAPSAANIYQSAFTLRAAATATFQGASLEILSGGDLRIKNNGTAATVNNLILDNGGIVDLGTAGAATLAGKISLPSGQAYIAGGTSGGGALTVSSIISGAGGLITSPSLISGPGTNIFTGANTYAGPTTINNSTNPVSLQLGNANAVQNSTVTVSLANGLKFSPGIGAFNIGGLAGSVVDTLADTGGAAVTLAVGGNDASTAYSGALGGSGALTKVGTGTLTLSGANTYAGATTISAGTLALGAGGSLAAASSVNLAAGATLDVSAQTTYTFGSGATLSASGNASAASIKGGTTVSLGSQPVSLTYNGANPALTLSAGALQLNDNAFTVIVPGTALAAGTYTLVATPNAITGAPNPTPSFTGGNGIASGETGTVSVSGDNLILTVTNGTGGGGPGPVSASHSTLGPDLASLTANGTNTQVITVQARDANNVNETNGGATVVFAVSGSGTISATTDNHNGTYTATLTAPASASLGTITATLNGSSVGTLVSASECAATYFSANFGDPVPGLTVGDTTNFNNGSVSFNVVQTVASGLGPIYNNSGCANCHNFPVPGGSGTATVTRFGEYTNGVFNPLTSQGGSLLQDNSTTTNFEVIPANANVIAKRITQHMFGIGLVEAIAESTIESNAAVANPDGIVGTVAFVTDLVTGQQMVGRFGWKAQHATLLSFTADAANNEVGITSRIEPVGQAPNGNTNLYNELNTVPDPNDKVDASGKADIDRDADFQRLIGPPPTLPLTANAIAGKALFTQIHCDACHTPSLPTSPNFIPVSDLALVTNHVITALSSKSAQLYSDLLLHNMGSLADGIAQAAANTNQMRTAPLWGLRESQPYLHDGRALTVDAAIRAHAGDGAISATRYVNLSTNQQAQVVDFLNSL